VGAARRFAQPLGVPQPLALRGDLRPLLWDRRHLLDLRELVAVQVEVALARSFPLAQLGQLRRQQPALAVRFAVVLAQGQVPGAGEPVEDLQLGRGDRQAAVLVLAEEGDQAAAQQLQVGGGRGPAGDEGAGATARRDAPAENHLLRALGQPLGQLCELGLGQQARGQVEDALDPGLGRARPNYLGFGLAAHQQVQRVRQHGLAGTGLAGDCVQPLPQPQLGPLDEE
jgi:hypothetical protein